MVGVVRSFAYFIGPLISGYLVVYGDRIIVTTAAIVLFIAYMLFLVIMRRPAINNESDIDVHGINIYEELRHWFGLGRRVWPILLISLMGGLIDATFWTTGTVLNDTLSEKSTMGGWFMSSYLLPFLFVGLIVAKWGIDIGKKKWAERFMFLGGISLIILPFLQDIRLTLLFVFITGVFLSLAWPLADAVYTDLIARAHKGRKHIMGMSSATISIAYIIGPILSGFLAGIFGEMKTFAIIGGIVATVALILLLTTPRKLNLPQVEMKNWE